MLSKWLFHKGGTCCAADSLHHKFLCLTAGISVHCKNRELLLREFHRISLPYRWTLLAVSWWEKLQGSNASKLAYQALQADVDLVLRGRTTCWTYHFLLAVERLGVIDMHQWRYGMPGVSRGSIMALNITRNTVHEALMAALHNRWTLSYGNTIDPRVGGLGVQLRTHMFWVHDIENGVLLSRANAPAYMKFCMPLKKLQCMARYRLGGSHLVGRSHLSGRPTMLRHCPLCSTEKETCRPIWRARLLSRCSALQPEDLMHFLLHCPAYDHIREQFPDVFQLPVSAAPVQRLRHAFDAEDQHSLVQCVWQMDLYRSHLLGLGYLGHARICHQPDGYIPCDPALRCTADFNPQYAMLRPVTFGKTVLLLVASMILLLAVAAGRNCILFTVKEKDPNPDLC